MLDFRTASLLFIFFLLNQSVQSQTLIDSSATEYKLQFKEGNSIQTLCFYKYKDSSSFHSFTFKSNLSETKHSVALEQQIKIIDTLWKEAEKHVAIQLRSIDVGYPAVYSDVLKRQIIIFSKSKSWQNHLKKNGKKLDLVLMREIMLKEKTYKLLDSILTIHGYSIKNISTEKHGFLSKEELIKAGFTGKEIIPMPFMVYLILQKNK